MQELGRTFSSRIFATIEEIMEIYYYYRTKNYGNIFIQYRNLRYWINKKI